MLKIARHLTTKHKNEIEVSKLMAAKESKTRYKEYLLGIQRLKCKGNFIHNIEVLGRGGSDIVVSKRPSKLRPAADFLPCMYCYGFFVCEELWKHVKNCELRDAGEAYDYRKTLSLSRALLESAILPDGAEEGWAREVRECVLSRMNHDDIYRAVKKDKLILRFGAVLIKKLGKAKALDISQRMRQLGRLLITLLQMDSAKSGLENFISGECFDTVIQATEELCGVMTMDDGRRAFKIPSFAVRLGHLLVKIGNVKRGCALRSKNDSDHLDADNFLSLMKSEWTDAVSSCALNTLKRRKDHEVQILPLTEDLVKVKDHMVKEMDKKVKDVLSNHDYFTWRKLAQMTMARLILFNKRRGGEVSRLLLYSYQNRPKWEESMNNEILSSLQDLELTLIKRLDLIEVPGKKNRKVPILVTQETKTAMETLIKTREYVGIPEKNPFFFASKSVDGYLNSWQALKAVVDGANVNNPASISSTRLRKYIATVCQLFDLKEGEMEWLANHMGHELNIHRDFYRLHESTVEIAKVSRVLMAIDAGQARKYTGKSLNEIGLDDIDFQPDDFAQDQVENENELTPCDITQEEPFHEISAVTDQQSCAAKRKKKTVPQLDVSSDEEVTSSKKKKKTVPILDSHSDDEVTKETRHYSTSLKKKWTTLELSTLKSAFCQFLQDKIYPSGKKMKEAINKYPCLKDRTIPQIRSKLQHLMG